MPFRRRSRRPKLVHAVLAPCLLAAAALARRHGSAIAIGHPYLATLAILAGWLPDAERRGVRLVAARPLTRVAGCAPVVVVA